MKLATGLALLATITLSAAHSTARAESDDKKPHHAMAEMNKESREKMAVAHEKFAACLRTDKPFHECHEELMKECMAAGGGSCPMMGMKKGMHKGMKMGK